MSNKVTVFYKGKKEISVDFQANEISSDGAVVLLEKIERKHKLINYISKLIPDKRNPKYITHSIAKLLKQRVFLLMQGYEDANDVRHLKNDPLLSDILDGDLASQPTISRFENSLDKHSIFTICYSWLERYISTIGTRKSITIDIDATDDPTHGCQQLSMFNGFYGQFMYNELFFHDGETGQIIMPVLRPGNSHSNKWYVSILKRIVNKIREKYPDIEILIRADSGFSNAPFYKLADNKQLLYAIGIASNNRLKQKVSEVSNEVEQDYLNKNLKHQEFISFEYKARSWHKHQQCYSKVESTGIGMNIRHFVSNLPDKTAEEIYFGFYVKRGETSENRIKEVKNMCFSDRLSNHAFWANFFRLLISSIAYELFLIIKEMIKETGELEASKWQIGSIRVYLLKIGATIKHTKRRVYYSFSKAFVFKNLFLELVSM